MTPFIGVELIDEPFSSARRMDARRRQFIKRIAFHILARSPELCEVCLRQVQASDIFRSFAIWSDACSFLGSRYSAIYDRKIPDDIMKIAEGVYEAADHQSMAMAHQTKFVLCFYDGLGQPCGAAIFSIKERKQLIAARERALSKKRAKPRNKKRK